MSIRHVLHKDIDLQLWNEAIAGASNAVIYADAWYLDISTNKQWDALILGDYEVVMPLPYNRKLFGYYQIYQPLFSQQLGVFSQKTSIDVQPFIDTIPKKYRRIYYPLNYQNAGSSNLTKTNLVIDLSVPYSETQARFSSSLRKRLRKSAALTFSEFEDVNALIQFYQTQLEAKVKLGQKAYDVAFDLFSYAMTHQCAKMYVIKDNETTLAMGLFLNKYNRLVNVFGASKSTKTNSNTMSILLAKVMEHHSEQPVTFDFEGSEIPGVKTYFESFGSVEQNYPVLIQDNLPKWIKLIR
ncbi:MAG: hypothetical protein ACI9JN_000058 [Bacteroidia bacterium]|jgi:hypothetical protein